MGVSAPAASEGSGSAFNTPSRQRTGERRRRRSFNLGDEISSSNHGGLLLAEQRPTANKLYSSSAAGLIDLRPHCDRSPYVVNEQLPLRRVFRLFTTMGLRHLVVTDAHSCVVGMITRKDFLKTRVDEWRTLASVRREESHLRYMTVGAQELKNLLPNLLPKSPKSPPKEPTASPMAPKSQLTPKSQLPPK